MNRTEEYRLSTYRDYGPLQSKEHVRLVRNELSGKLYIKKILDVDKKPIFEFLKTHEQIHIPRIEECVISGGRLIVIEEYIEGRSLAAVLAEKTLGEKESAVVAAELCRAMQPLHEAEPPIVCRDLKAENVMIASDGTIKIVDFDIARIYQEGKNRDTVLMGTAEYAAPEQFGYFQTDSRTDIYALGVLLNYMLTGRFPVEKIAAGRLEPVVRKCISMNPEDRYQSVEELEKDLVALAGLEEIHLPAPEPAKETKTDKKKSWMIPGFRTHTPWKMCAALLGYIFMGEVCYKLEFTARDAGLVPLWCLRMEQTILFLSQLAEVLLICNYRGWRDQLPILGNRSIMVRIIGYVGTEILFFLTAFFICAFLELLILG